MGSSFCLYLVFLVACVTLPCTWGKGMDVRSYFQEINRDFRKVTWAHAINTRELLDEAIANSSIMMIEVDIRMGTYGDSTEVQPVLAHPPATSSDLTFPLFLDTVLKALKEDEKRKGIKLDFKDIEAVEPVLKHLRDTLEDEDAPSFPIFINADILPGPVNATKKPLDADRFLYLAKAYAKYAVLSVGWTTRYGVDDPSQEIREGKYTREMMIQMRNLLKTHNKNRTFTHITVPVRASLAAQSVDDIMFLLPRIQATTYSITLWSPKSDPVNRLELSRLIQLATQDIFIDLPFSMDDHSDYLGERAENLEAHDDHNDHKETPDEKGISEIQQLEGRAHPEHHHNENKLNESAGASSYNASCSKLLAFLALGLLGGFLLHQNN